MEKKYLKVGTYVPGTEEKGPVIQRDYYRQGWIFKDEEAFLSHADQVCYVPELSDGDIPGRISWNCAMGRRISRWNASGRWTGSARRRGWMSSTGRTNGDTARNVKRYMIWPGRYAPARYAGETRRRFWMEIRKVDAGRLNPAAYNPRRDLKPGDKDYEKLKRSIEEFGFVEPVVWNERTGFVVGGHQRLKVLLDMGVTQIDCVVVDMEPEREKALNVALNRIQGDWDEGSWPRCWRI